MTEDKLTIEEAKKVLKNIHELHLYENYIRMRLAGDFAVDMVRAWNKRTSQIPDNTITIVDKYRLVEGGEG